MISQAWANKRRLVPRWRSLDQTARAGELTAISKAGTRSRSANLSSELVKRLAAWRRDPGLLSAAELVETAIVEGKDEVAVNAARRLLLQERFATPLIHQQARQLLERTGYGNELPEKAATAAPHPIAFWRARTRLQPHDALSWIELALAHVVDSHHESARRAMLVALQLAPENRHALRSGARLFLHLHAPDQAHDLLARSAATRFDPWLLAAEISIADIAERPSRFAKVGRSLLEGGGLIPRLTTELAGALATCELVAGGHKRARKLFTQSMMDPTGNALAQAEWASPFAGSSLVPPARLSSVQEASEAQAFHAFIQENYAAVAPACEAWAVEEPYSIRPFEFGATVASMSDEHDVALDFATRGLRLRANASKLLNSQAFALASLGRLEEAERSLAQMPADGLDETCILVAEANRGLIAFRRGEKEAGLQRYEAAIRGFQKAGNKQLVATAKIYFGRELAYSGDALAQQVVYDAEKTWRQLHGNRAHPALTKAIEKLREPQAPTPTQTWFAQAVIPHGAGTSTHQLPLVPMEANMKIGRNAGTGKFTTVKQAQAKPKTHVVETVKSTPTKSK